MLTGNLAATVAFLRRFGVYVFPTGLVQRSMNIRIGDNEAMAHHLQSLLAALRLVLPQVTITVDRREDSRHLVVLVNGFDAMHYRCKHINNIWYYKNELYQRLDVPTMLSGAGAFTSSIDEGLKEVIATQPLEMTETIL